MMAANQRATTGGKLHFDAGGPHPAARLTLIPTGPHDDGKHRPHEKIFHARSFRLDYLAPLPVLVWRTHQLESASHTKWRNYASARPRRHCRYEPLNIHRQDALAAAFNHSSRARSALHAKKFLMSRGLYVNQTFQSNSLLRPPYLACGKCST